MTNLIFGKLLLKAKVTQTMLAGTALTVAGTVMAVQFSSKETLDLTLDEIVALYGNPGRFCAFGDFHVRLRFSQSHSSPPPLLHPQCTSGTSSLCSFSSSSSKSPTIFSRG